MLADRDAAVVQMMTRGQEARGDGRCLGRSCMSRPGTFLLPSVGGKTRAPPMFERLAHRKANDSERLICVSHGQPKTFGLAPLRESTAGSPCWYVRKGAMLLDTIGVTAGYPLPTPTLPLSTSPAPHVRPHPPGTLVAVLPGTVTM